LAYIEKDMNFTAGWYNMTGIKSKASIIYYPPQGVTIDHFRVTLYDTPFLYYAAAEVCMDRIVGKFRQYDVNNSLLREDSFNIPRGSSATFPAQSGVDHVELYIESWDHIMTFWGTQTPIDEVLSGTGKEIIRIATEDGANAETSSLRLKSYRVITYSKTYEEVQVTGEQPTRIFNVSTSKISPYLSEWAVEIVSVSGSADPNVDKVFLQLLDVSDNILASVDVGVSVGNIGYVTHNTNTAKVRVYLSTTKRLIVVCKVYQCVSIGYNV